MSDSRSVVAVEVSVWEDGAGGWHWSWEVPGDGATYVGSAGSHDEAVERAIRAAEAHYAGLN